MEHETSTLNPWSSDRYTTPELIKFKLVHHYDYRGPNIVRGDCGRYYKHTLLFISVCDSVRDVIAQEEKPTPPKMPVGLVQLMEGMTREVLKNNPTDVYEFCAGHMQQLLEKRDGPFKKITLEEKIAKAQEKVRQRAEKRRQQYDYDLLHRQHSANALETNIDGGSCLPSQEHSSVITLKTTINQDHELVNSSVVEISQEPGAESHTPSEDPYNESVDETSLKHNDVLKNDVNSETMTEYKHKRESDIMESTQTSDRNTIAQDVPVSELPNTESSIPKPDLLDNEHSIESKNVSNLSESMIDAQTTYGEDHVNEEIQEFGEVKTNQHSPSPVNSMTFNQDGLLNDTTEKNMNDSAHEEIKSINDQSNSNKDTNIKLDEQSSFTQTVTELQGETVHESNNVEESEQPNDTQITQLHIDDGNIIKPSNDIKNVELSNNSGTNVIENKEDTIESKTIDLCYRESPSIELQDPVIDTDMLESVPTTETDFDIDIDDRRRMNLILTTETDYTPTQDSTNDDLKLSNALKNDISLAMESAINVELPPLDKESSNEAVDENTQYQNKIIPLNSETDKPITITNNTNENNNINNEEDKSIKQSENHQMCSQDTNNMDLETAAITIQKVFRTFLFKSRASTFDETSNEEIIFLDEDDKNKEECNFPITGALNTERRPHGITRMDTVLQTVNEEKSLSLSTDDSSLSSAATVIQAHVRGFLVRNKLNSNKTVSTNSLAASNSNEPSLTSLETDNDQNKNKTVLNIHIVPEGGNYLSRDGSLITSMDLSLDSSLESSSINLQLHPLGYDKSERRKQLKREDAIQSISPPSNNSGKLSEDVDSVKELPLNDHVGIDQEGEQKNSVHKDSHESTIAENITNAPVENIVLKSTANEVTADTQDIDNSEINIKQKRKSLTKINSDEMDVVTAFVTKEENNSSDLKLMHSGEFHDAMLPTKVSRSDTSVASGE